MPQCQNCGGDLSFIEEYDRWYCYDCEEYAPKEETPTPGARPCPICRKELAFIEDYDRWYCYDCEEYAPQTERFCPTCDGPLAYIEEYERWYCFACEAYPSDEEDVVPVAVGVDDEATPAEEASHEIPEAPPEAEAVEEAPAFEEAPEEEMGEGPEEAKGEAPAIDVEAVEAATKAALVKMAKAHGLKVSGKKAEVKARLLARAAELEAEAAEEEEAVIDEAEEPAEEEAIPAEEEPVEEEVPSEEAEAVHEEEAAPETEPTPEVAAEEAPPVAVEPTPDEIPPEKPKAPPAARKVKPVPFKKARAAAECPTCAGELTYIEDYGRHYCHSCGNYAPKDMTARLLAAEEAARTPREARPEADACPTCGGGLRYIPDYGRHYCDSCGNYAPKDMTARLLAAEKPVRPVRKVRAEAKACPTCGEPLTFNKQYERWYCRRCGTYAPEEAAVKKGPAEKPCPNCGAALSYIPEYKREYCYTCGNYAPIEEAAPAPKEVAAVEAPVVSETGPARPFLALAGTIQIVLGFILFLISTIITLLVWGGVVGEFFLYQGGDFVITAYGPLAGALATSSSIPFVNSFNILLFVALIFGVIGLVSLAVAFLPKRK